MVDVVVDVVDTVVEVVVDTYVAFSDTMYEFYEDNKDTFDTYAPGISLFMQIYAHPRATIVVTSTVIVGFLTTGNPTAINATQALTAGLVTGKGIIESGQLAAGAAVVGTVGTKSKEEALKYPFISRNKGYLTYIGLTVAVLGTWETIDKVDEYDQDIRD